MLTPATGSIILFGALGISLITLISTALRLIEMRSRMGTTSYRIEAKLDLLLKQANIEFDQHANIPRECVDALRAGQKIRAIKLYRESTGIGLREAKELIEDYAKRVK